MAATSSLTAVISVEVLLDMTCPWCYFALKHLNAALQRHGKDYSFEITFAPYFLFPGLAPEGMSVTPCMQTDDVKAAAAAACVALDESRRLKRTHAAHAALRTVVSNDASLGLAFVLRLMALHFEQGKDISDVGVCLSAARDAGCVIHEPASFCRAASDPDTWALIDAEAAAARAAGRTRVPRFSCQRKGARRVIAFEGALSTEVFDDLVDELS